jgi:hypothetical protein
MVEHKPSFHGVAFTNSPIFAQPFNEDDFPYLAFSMTEVEDGPANFIDNMYRTSKQRHAFASQHALCHLSVVIM